MRSRSRWYAILVAFSAGTTLTVAACSSDVAAPPPVEDNTRIATEKKVEELRQRYGWIGDYHTDGLAYVYLQLEKSTKGKAKKSTKAELCRVAAKAVKEFHKQARKGEIPFGLVDPAIADETCLPDNNSRGVGKNILVGNPTVRYDDLSPIATSYLNQVSDAINSATSRAALLSNLLNIQYSAVATLPELEAGTVVATVSVAISSMDYWEANMDAWISIPGLATPYSRAGSAGAASLIPQAAALARVPKWWTHPFIQNYIKVLSADAAGGARVLYLSWRLGPVGYDAAAASALFSSVSMMMSLLF